MQVSAAVFFGLARAAVASGVAWVRRAGEDAIEQVRPAPRATEDDSQLRFWVRDGEGLPERPWRISADLRFPCLTLNCVVSAADCVARQRVSDRELKHDVDRERTDSSPHKRGIYLSFANCVTARCAQGRGLRQALGDDAAKDVRHGERHSADKRRQREAEARQASQPRIPTLEDGPPEEEGDTPND